MAVKEILQLGNPLLNRSCEAVRPGELNAVQQIVADLHDTLTNFQQKEGVGRAMAAPQIGVLKRIVYMHIDSPVVFINPAIHDPSDEMIELWDDCLSFPDLLVKVRRHRFCSVTYRDLNFTEHTIRLADDLSELLQHECDHLDGILTVSRAIDGKSFCLRSQFTFQDGRPSWT